MNTPVVIVQDLKRSFGTFVAVDGISFKVDAGECFGLLGPNGAGKTTTIKMLTTLLKPTSGSAQVAGMSVDRSPAAVRARIGYVPQAISSDGGLTGRENLNVMAQLFGLSPQERKERIPQVLAMLDLEDAADRVTRNYSGGMIRRLEVGQAILHRPHVLFLDEPTIGLDPVARRSLWSYIQTLQTQFNMAIVLTTHYMDEAESMCSRIAMMTRGKIAAAGTLSELQASIGNDKATLEDVFTSYAESSNEGIQGGMKDVQRGRRTASRLA